MGAASAGATGTTGVRALLIALVLVLTLGAATLGEARAEVPIAPYGTNDAGGFRNVLPSGENGLDNAAQLSEFQLNGTYPPHFKDQLPLYAGLLHASPTLTLEQIPSYFKDATFGIKGGVASTESPRSDVTIARDSAFGIPHIYGSTRAGVMFGAGYAAAADRLFLMDVLRHTGRAELSSFIGGAEGNRAMDRTQWLIAPYTEADLQAQLENAPKLYGAEGTKVVGDLNEFVAGINAYVTAALLDPTKMPAEYAGIGKSPTLWKATDVIAEASLIGGIFGKGGGAEVRSALALESFEKRYGMSAGRAAWRDFREHNDREAPTTVSKAFPYETNSPFSATGLAMPDPGSVSFVSDGEPVAAAARAGSPASSGSGEVTATPAPQQIPSDGSLGSQLLHQALSGPPHASNWELISAKHSTNGHPIAVMGPQVGYFNPQILMEEDLHGPGIDARGAAFPGVNLYVELGHGRDYAWSATTATSDNVDTFAEILCQDELHYLYKGQCLPMEKLERTNAWTPNGSDKTPPGSEKLTVYRTVHGIVYAHGTVNGQKVAFTSARTTYFHEADSAVGFSQFNEPGFITSPQQFQHAASNIDFAFNWAYVDANHIAYYLSGAYPQRAARVSPDFPVFGTGAYDWQGFEPKLHTMEVLPFEAHPNAIDPSYLVSWNNKQALGTPSDPQLQQAVAKLDSWYADGGHRRDLTNPSISSPGTYQHNEAVTILDAWWPKLLEAEFRPAIGGEAFGAVQSLLAFGGPYPGAQPAAPDYDDGWYSYVSKDLRDMLAAHGLGPAPKAPYSQIYCGGGSLEACQHALQSSLAEALSQTPQQIYGHGACAEDAQASCFDMNRFVGASAISVPPFPFQNRPTFQQVVELTKTLPR